MLTLILIEDMEVKTDELEGKSRCDETAETIVDPAKKIEENNSTPEMQGLTTVDSEEANTYSREESISEKEVKTDVNQVVFPPEKVDVDDSTLGTEIITSTTEDIGEEDKEENNLILILCKVLAKKLDFLQKVPNFNCQ